MSKDISCNQEVKSAFIKKLIKLRDLGQHVGDFYGVFKYYGTHFEFNV